MRTVTELQQSSIKQSMDTGVKCQTWFWILVVNKPSWWQKKHVVYRGTSDLSYIKLFRTSADLKTMSDQSAIQQRTDMFTVETGGKLNCDTKQRRETEISCIKCMCGLCGGKSEKCCFFFVFFIPNNQQRIYHLSCVVFILSHLFHRVLCRKAQCFLYIWLSAPG